MAGAEKKVKLNVSKFEEYQRIHDLGESQVAIAMGISREQLWRAKNGAPVGVSFIAGTMDVFADANYRDFFYIDNCMHARNEMKGGEKNAV